MTDTEILDGILSSIGGAETDLRAIAKVHRQLAASLDAAAAAGLEVLQAKQTAADTYRKMAAKLEE